MPAREGRRRGLRQAPGPLPGPRPPTLGHPHPGGGVTDPWDIDLLGGVCLCLCVRPFVRACLMSVCVSICPTVSPGAISHGNKEMRREKGGRSRVSTLSVGGAAAGRQQAAKGVAGVPHRPQRGPGPTASSSVQASTVSCSAGRCLCAAWRGTIWKTSPTPLRGLL